MAEYSFRLNECPLMAGSRRFEGIKCGPGKAEAFDPKRSSKIT